MSTRPAIHESPGSISTNIPAVSGGSLIRRITIRIACGTLITSAYLRVFRFFEITGLFLKVVNWN